MNRPVAGVGSANTPQQWFRDLPIITKILLCSTLFTAAATNFQFINPMNFIFSWPMIWQKFQIWRLFTPFVFAGGFSFPFLMHVYILYQNSLRYEQNPFNTGARGTSADYLFMLLFGMAILCIAAVIFELAVLSEALLYMIMYVWSRRDPVANVSIFGFQFQASYLPWVYVVFRMLMGSSILLPLFGIGVGHLYYFLVDVLPTTHNMDLLLTPKFCVDIIESLTGFTQPRVQAPPRAVPGRATQAPVPPRGGYQWGQGRTLGER